MKHNYTICDPIIKNLIFIRCSHHNGEEGAKLAALMVADGRFDWPQFVVVCRSRITPMSFGKAANEDRMNKL